MERTCGNSVSLADLRVNTTVAGSGAATDPRLWSSEEGPFLSAIASCRSKLNLTSEEVSSCPLANFRPGFSVTVQVVGSVSAIADARSGDTSDEPFLALSRVA